MENLSLIASWVGWPVVAAVMLVAGGYAFWVQDQRLQQQKEIREEMKRQFNKQGQGTKVLEHYLLFWRRNENDWAGDDWKSARDYIAKFHPTCGFSRYDAALAQKITIIGKPTGVDERVEEFLEKQGCQVERLDGKNGSDTAELLQERVDKNQAFVGGQFRRGY